MKIVFIVLLMAGIIAASTMVAPVVFDPKPSSKLLVAGSADQTRAWIDRYGNISHLGFRFEDDTIKDLYREDPDRAQEIIKAPSPNYTQAQLDQFVETSATPAR